MKKIYLFFIFTFSLIAVKAQNFNVTQDSCFIDTAYAVVNAGDDGCTIYWIDSGNYVSHNLALVDGFDPCMGETPEDGVLTVVSIGPLTKNRQNDNTQRNANPELLHSYNFNQFGLLNEGYYAFAVQAICDSLGNHSRWAFTNVVTHLMKMTYNLQIFKQDGSSPDSVVVTLDGGNCANNYVYQLASNTGNVSFTDISKGTYVQTISIPNVYTHSDTLTLDNDTSNTVYLNISSVQNKISTTNGFKLYPNPATSYSILYSNKNIKQLFIYNPMGQLVFKKTKINAKQLSINTKGLKKGIYFVNIKTDNTIMSKKLIIR